MSWKGLVATQRANGNPRMRQHPEPGQEAMGTKWHTGGSL